MDNRLLVALTLALVFIAGCNQKAPEPVFTAEEARAIAKDAYVYGFPLVDSYRIQHAYFVDANNPEYKGSWNEIHSIARVYTPDA